MKLNTEDISSTRKEITVSVPADEISKTEKELIGQFSRQAKIKGFRPGKAPESMIMAQHGKQIAEELSRKILTKAYDCVMKESGLNISCVVDADKDSIEKAEDTDIKFTADIVPDFELPEYKEIEVESPNEDVSEDEIQEAIKAMLEQRADYKEVEREAQTGDYVKVSYEGKIGDKLVAEIVPDKPIYGTQSVTWEEAGSENSPGVQAIVQGIIAMKVGDKKTVKQKFEDDFEVPELAGKDVSYEVEVFEVREKVLPEIDEEMLKSMNVKSKEELSERVKEEIVSNKKRENNGIMRRQILEHITGKVDFELPESSVEMETQNMLANYMREQMNMGVPQEEFEKNKDELVERARKEASGQVRISFLLARIAEAEEIKIKNEDLQQRIMQEAMMTRTKPEDFVKELQKDSARLKDIQRSVLFNKTLDFLVDSAKVTIISGSEQK